MIHPDRLQGLAGRLGEGPLSQWPGVQGLGTQPASGGQDVEATADGHGGLAGEHVTAGLWDRLDPQGEVDDDLAGVNDPSRHGRLRSGEAFRERPIPPRSASSASQTGASLSLERVST